MDASLIVAIGSALIAAASAATAISARSAADRSADAAEASAAASTRSAVAAERANELATPGVGTGDVRWEIIPAGRAMRLMNVGSSTATGVTLHRGDLPDGLTRGFPMGATIEAQDGVDILIVSAGEYRVPASLLVTWDGQDGGARVPLAPR